MSGSHGASRRGFLSGSLSGAAARTGGFVPTFAWTTTAFANAAANETDAISLVAVPEPAAAWWLGLVIPGVVGWSRHRRGDSLGGSSLS